MEEQCSTKKMQLTQNRKDLDELLEEWGSEIGKGDAHLFKKLASFESWHNTTHPGHDLNKPNCNR
jgi:hypothetical protein